jgi:hypothetical protein
LNGPVQFPISILPKASYVLTIDFPSLIENQEVFILRRSDRPKEETFNELGLLRVDVLKPKEIPFLSLNLLGGDFISEYSRFRIFGKGMERWPGDIDISLEDYPGCFNVIEQICNIFLNANGLHGQKIQYQQPQTKDLTKQVDEFFKGAGKIPVPQEGVFEFEGLVNLVHDPTNLNYWHLEYNLFDYKGIPFKKVSSTYTENFCKTVISNIICANSSSEAPEIKGIPKEFYLKG